MTENNEKLPSKDGEEKQPLPGIDYIVSLDELEQFDINSVFEKVKSVDCQDIKQHLDNFKNQNPTKASGALDIIEILLNFCLAPNDRENPFGPMWRLPNEERSPIPSDFEEGQIKVIAEFTPKIVNPGLRARLADVSWFLQRKPGMAEIAISAYCESVEKVREGKLVFSAGDAQIFGGSFPDKSAWGINAGNIMARAARISYATKWELKASKRFKKLLRDLLETAYKNNNGDSFYRMGMISLDLGESVLPIVQLAELAEELAEKLDAHPDLLADLFHLARNAYRKVSDKKKVEKCDIAIAECFIQKADFAESEIEKALHLQTAIIKMLKDCPRTQEQRRKLTDLLLKIQPHTLEKMKYFSVEINLEHEIKKSTDSVRGLSWSDAFNSFMQCYFLPTEYEIRDIALKYANDHPLQTIITNEICDAEGRGKFRAETEEANLQRLMSWFRGIHRKCVVLGIINPSREAIVSEHQISNEVLSDLLQDKPFIADGYKDIYIRAISQFLPGNNIEAASLLVPQLENSLRFILASNDHDTTVVDKKGIQNEASLPILLDPKQKWRELLEKIIPAKYIVEIDLLFNFQGGPSIRNRFAHGQIPNGEFHSYECIYAVWLIIHLAVFYPDQLSE